MLRKITFLFVFIFGFFESVVSQPRLIYYYSNKDEVYEFLKNDSGYYIVNKQIVNFQTYNGQIKKTVKLECDSSYPTRTGYNVPVLIIKRNDKKYLVSILDGKDVVNNVSYDSISFFFIGNGYKDFYFKVSRDKSKGVVRVGFDNAGKVISNEIIPVVYDDILKDHNGFFVAKNNNKKRIINFNGDERPLFYDYIKSDSICSSGLTILGLENKKGLYADSAKSCIVPFFYDLIDFGGNCTALPIIKLKDKYGFLKYDTKRVYAIKNKEEVKVISPVYDFLKHLSFRDNHFTEDHFDHGHLYSLFLIKSGQHYGVINSNQDTLVMPKYKNIRMINYDVIRAESKNQVTYFKINADSISKIKKYIFFTLGIKNYGITVGNSPRAHGVCFGNPDTCYGLRISLWDHYFSNNKSCVGVNIVLFDVHRKRAKKEDRHSYRLKYAEVRGLNLSILKLGAIPYKTIGCEIGLFNNTNNEIKGVQLGAANIGTMSYKKSFQLGIVNFSKDYHGFQFGVVNLGTRSYKKNFQLGIANFSNYYNGFQLGILNKGHVGRYTQIGLLNNGMRPLFKKNNIYRGPSF